MFAYLLDKIFPSKYESKIFFDNYIKCQYGPFLKNSPYLASESFYKIILSESAPFVNFTSDTLDAGCATGRLVFEFEKMGARKSFGVDTSKRFIDFCDLLKTKGSKFLSFQANPSSQATFIRADISRYKFKENSFDFISCINIIDRALDPKKLIEALYLNLKPKAVLLLVDPYDWKSSPAPENLHVSDMKILLDNDKWVIEKEIRDIPYTIPISSRDDRIYLCHLIIARKI